MPEAPNRWWVTATIMIGTLASVLASSTINVALTDIMNGLQTNLSVIDWVVTAYMLANVIAMPCTGWLGEVLGRRNLYVLGLVVFMLGSLLAGAAWSIESLIAFRVLQGLGGGLMMPTAQAILFDTFPADQRGTAMGIYGLGAILGPAFGPTLGGWLVEVFNWRSLFFINLPFAVLSLVMLFVLVPSRAAPRARAFDGWGFLWLVLALGGLQLALGNGARDGWSSAGIIGLFALAAVSGALLLVREFSVEDPLIDFSVFANRGYLMGSIVSTALGLGLYGSTFLLPLFLGSVLGYSALQIGVLMVAGSLTMGVMMLVGGRLSDRIDARWLIGGGLLVFAYSLHMQAGISLDTPDATYVWALVWRGVGMGLVFSPLSAVTLAALHPRQLGSGAGLFNLTRQLGGTVGIALLKTFLQNRTVVHVQQLSETAGLSGMGRRTVAGWAQFLVQHGASAATAPGQAGAMLAGLIRRQGSVLAFDDAFWVSMVLIAACVLPTLLLRRRPPVLR